MMKFYRTILLLAMIVLTAVGLAACLSNEDVAKVPGGGGQLQLLYRAAEGSHLYADPT